MYDVNQLSFKRRTGHQRGIVQISTLARRLNPELRRYDRRARGGPSGASPPSHGVGWLLGSSPDANGYMGHKRIKGSSPSQKSGLGLSSSVPLPEFQHPSHALLEDAGFSQMKYTHYRDRCLADRQELGAKGIGARFRVSSLCCRVGSGGKKKGW